jgi:hypothetical protein
VIGAFEKKSPGSGRVYDMMKHITHGTIISLGALVIAIKARR